MAHIFISYKHEDGDSAELVRNRLEKEGFDTWMDSDIQGGEKWSAAIDLAIRNSGAVVVIMSPEARKSEFTTYEWSFALGVGKTVVPILLRTTELHPKLAEIQYIDFTHRNARPWDRLISRLKSTLQNDSNQKNQNEVDEIEIESNRKGLTTHYQGAIPKLIADLIDPNVSVRIKAIKALARIGDEQALKGIIDALNDSDKSVRIAAADALGNFHSVLAVSALIKTLQDKIGYVRAHAAKSLGIIGDNRAIPALSKLLSDETPTVRNAAYEALEKMSSIKAHDAIVDWRKNRQNQNSSNDSMQELRESIQGYTISLGSDVRFKQLKHYIVYERRKNFISIMEHTKHIDIFLNLNPDDVELETGFTQDMRHKGHLGTGDLLVTIENANDLERAKALIKRSYELN